MNGYHAYMHPHAPAVLAHNHRHVHPHTMHAHLCEAAVCDRAGLCIQRVWQFPQKNQPISHCSHSALLHPLLPPPPSPPLHFAAAGSAQSDLQCVLYGCIVAMVTLIHAFPCKPQHTSERPQTVHMRLRTFWSL